jgi:hypothetical protein
MFIRQAVTTFAILHSEARRAVPEQASCETTGDARAVEPDRVPPAGDGRWVIDWRWLAD